MAIVSNTISNTAYGIDAQNVDDFVISDNTVTKATTYGFLLKDVGNGRVTKNTIDSSMWTGIYATSRKDAAVVLGDNILIDPANNAAGNGPDKNSAIYLGGGRFSLTNNTVKALAPKYLWNIFVDSSATASASGNNFPNSKKNSGAVTPAPSGL